MKRLRKFGIALVLTLACLAFFSSLSFAVDSRCLPAAEEVSQAKPTALRLFGINYIRGSLKISHEGAGSQLSRVEAKLVPTIFSRKGLESVIKTPGGAQALIDMLLRIGAIKAEVVDPFYAEMILAAENVPVDLNVPHHDPVVNRFLKAKMYLKKAEADGLSTTIPKVYDTERFEFIYWQTLKALDRVPDDNRKSLDAVIATFTEVARIGEDGRRYTPDEKLQQIKIILEGLRAEAEVIPAEIEIREEIRSPISDIPLADTAVSWTMKLFNIFLRKDREVKTRTIDPGDTERRENPIAKLILEKDLTEEVPGSYRLGFFERDPFGVGKKAQDFISEFATSDASLFSIDFANKMEQAYPELRTIRNRPGVAESVVGVQGDFVDKGPFGPGTYEGYKVMTRAALTLALVRGEHRYFPGISIEEFKILREDFISDLNLEKDGKIVEPILDQYFVFLILDSLGRGRSEFLDALEFENQFVDKIGADYERRSLAIIKKYRLASHSFARLEDPSQVKVMRWFQFIHLYNSGQIVQLEGARNSFQNFATAKHEDAAALFYRSLLSYASLWSGGESSGLSNLRSDGMKQWMAFRTGLFSLMKAGANPGDAYDSYVKWIAQHVDLPLSLDNPQEVTIIRLVAQSRAVENTKLAHLVNDQFNELSLQEQQTLVKFMTEYPILNYGLADLIAKVVSKTKDKPYLLAMKVIAQAYQKLSEMSDFQWDMSNHPNIQKKINFRFVVDFAIKKNPRVFLSPKTKFVALKHIDSSTESDSYEIRVTQ